MTTSQRKKFLSKKKRKRRVSRRRKNRRTRKKTGGGNGLSARVRAKARRKRRKTKKILAAARFYPVDKVLRRHNQNRQRSRPDARMATAEEATRPGPIWRVMLVLIMSVAQIQGKNPQKNPQDKEGPVFPENRGDVDYKVEETWLLHLACSGNTCRTPALMIAGMEQGVNITSCATKIDPSELNVNPALIDAVRDASVRRGDEVPSNIMDFAEEYQAQACNPCADIFLNRGKNIVYGVVTQEAGRYLSATAKKCGKEITIVVLGGLVKECESLKKDPYWDSTLALCPDSICTNEHFEIEKKAYKKLYTDAQTCVGALRKLMGRGVTYSF